MHAAGVVGIEAVVMGLGGRAAERKGRSGKKGRRRQMDEPADSRTATQRHARAPFYTSRKRRNRARRALRHAHSREGYGDAVTLGLTSRDKVARISPQVVGIATGLMGLKDEGD
jgi:hypothetical protein